MHKCNWQSIENQLTSAKFCLLEFSSLAAVHKILMNLDIGQIKVEKKNKKIRSAFPWNIASAFQSGVMQIIKIKLFTWQLKKAHMCYNFIFIWIYDPKVVGLWFCFVFCQKEKVLNYWWGIQVFDSFFANKKW